MKVVEWSEEDGCYVGTAPGLILGGVHGSDQAKVFRELCKVVDQAVDILKKEGRLPSPTVSKKYSGKILLRLPKQLHQALAVKALQAGESLNRLIQDKLSHSL